jgi:glycosyltransferase involved in cell wall biosynthesis
MEDKGGQKEPLISVIVITYNSAQFVVETLESIKQQTYQNIELIISDDCSKDDTLQICEEWLNFNKQRFVNFLIIKSDLNTGIPANCNRGIKYAKGEWTKLIAGDDAFYLSAIKNAVDFINNNSSIKAFSSSVAYYYDEFIDENLYFIRGNHLEFYMLDAKEQYCKLLRTNYIHGGSVFLRRDLYNELGLYIEKYKFLEDLPMWLKITSAGVKFHFMECITLKYRVHKKSISSNYNEGKIFNSLYLKKRKFHQEMVLPNLNTTERLWRNYEFYLKFSFDKFNLNRNNRFCRFIYYFFKQKLPVIVSQTCNSFKSKC